MMSTIPVDQNQGPTQLGGRRKKGNGHKANCKCPICKNMRDKKHGGGEEEVDDKIIGGKKKNGHKANCGCPICINMKHAKRSKRNRDNKRGGTKKRKQGGGEEKDELDMTSHGMDDDETKLDETQHGMDESEKKGGRKKKRGNGHKPNCKCPICKNMRKSKRGGDIEDQKEEKADDDDYDELDAMEKGPVVEETKENSDPDLDNMEKGPDILVDTDTPKNELSSLEEGKLSFNNPGADEKVGGKRRTRKHKSRRHKKHTRKHMRR